MRKLLLVLPAILLAGCAHFDNRVACTVSNDKAFFVSEYLNVGIAATISEKDKAAICKKEKTQ